MRLYRYHFRIQFEQSQKLNKFMRLTRPASDAVGASVRLVMLTVGQDLARVRCWHQSAAHTSLVLCHLDAQLTVAASLALQA